MSTRASDIETAGSCCVSEEPGARSHWTYRPHVDIVDATDAFIVEADLPGADADSINVTFDEEVLSIQAEVPPRVPGNDVEVLQQEYGVGSFHRRFVVEAEVNGEAIAADYRDGVLTVRLPKAEAARPRQIPVRA